MGADDGDFIALLLHADADVNETPGEGFSVVSVEPWNHALERLIVE